MTSMIEESGKPRGNRWPDVAERECFHSRIELHSGAWHSPDDAAVLILRNGVPTGSSQTRETSGTVSPHACEQYRYARRSISLTD